MIIIDLIKLSFEYKLLNKVWLSAIKKKTKLINLFGALVCIKIFIELSTEEMTRVSQRRRNLASMERYVREIEEV